jgi:GT2 family glycosyltransferase
VERLVAHVHAGDTVAGPISYQHGTVDTIDLATLCLDAADWTVSTPWRGEAHPRPASPSVLGTDYVTGSAVMAPAPLWRRLGGFYEPYFLTWEDTEFGVRARRLGYRAIVDPEAVAWHRGSATFGGTFTPLYRYYHTRNHLLFVRRNVPAWARVRAYRRAWHRLRLERRWQAEYGGDEGGRQAEAIRWAMRDFVLGRFGRLRRRI